MFVDASAIVAILGREPEGEALAKALNSRPARRCVTNPIAIWEAAASLHSRRNAPISKAMNPIGNSLEASSVAIADVNANDLAVALEAFERYGRHSPPKKIETGDSISATDSTTRQRKSGACRFDHGQGFRYDRS